MVGEGGGGQVRAPPTIKTSLKLRDFAKHILIHLYPSKCPQLIDPSTFFFELVLFQTSWRISIDTVGNSTLKLGNFPS